MNTAEESEAAWLQQFHIPLVVLEAQEGLFVFNFILMHTTSSTP